MWGLINQERPNAVHVSSLADIILRRRPELHGVHGAVGRIQHGRRSTETSGRLQAREEQEEGGMQAAELAAFRSGALLRRVLAGAIREVRRGPQLPSSRTESKRSAHLELHR